MALVPRLTPLDDAVLAVLRGRGDYPGQRARTVHARVGSHYQVSPKTVREVLRGLEAVGLAESRGGWWRAR